MKVALIGAGHIAQVHAPIIGGLPGSELVGVADRDLSRARAVAAPWGAAAYGDAGVLLAELSPEVVHILTPPASHAPLAISALEAGCHVLVEKPMAQDLASARKMAQAALASGKSLCVDHNMLFEETVARARALAHSGVLGEIVGVESVSQFEARRYPAVLAEGAQWSHWTFQELRGGPLEDMIPHPLSLAAEFLPGIEDLQFVSANRGVLPEPWSDELKVVIRGGGVLAYVDMSLSERPDLIRLTIKGTRGQVTADLFNGVLTLRCASGLPRAAARGLSGFSLAWQNFRGAASGASRVLRGKIDKTMGMAGLIGRFHAGLTSGAPNPVPSEQGLRVVEMLERIWPRPVARLRDLSPPAPDVLKATKGLALVTGASGFIGMHLVRKLQKEGHPVRGLVRPGSCNLGRLLASGAEVVQGDLSSPEALDRSCRGVRYVFHAAHPMAGGWEESKTKAVGGMARLLQSCQAAGVERLVHFGSLAVYELLDPAPSLVTEDATPYQKHPRRMGPYVWSKILTEKMALSAWQKQGLKVSIVRPGMVVGPGGNIFFPHFGYNLGDQTFALIGKQDHWLPFTYVANTVSGIYLAAMQEEAVGQAFNLVDDGEVSAAEFLTRLNEQAGLGARIFHLPYVTCWGATVAYEALSSFGLIKKGLTSRPQLRWKQSPARFSNQKAKDLLGWKMEVPLHEGLNRAFTWYGKKYYQS